MVYFKKSVGDNNSYSHQSCFHYKVFWKNYDWCGEIIGHCWQDNGFEGEDQVDIF